MATLGRCPTVDRCSRTRRTSATAAPTHAQGTRIGAKNTTRNRNLSIPGQTSPGQDRFRLPSCASSSARRRRSTTRPPPTRLNVRLQGCAPLWASPPSWSAQSQQGGGWDRQPRCRDTSPLDSGALTAATPMSLIPVPPAGLTRRAERFAELDGIRVPQQGLGRPRDAWIKCGIPAAEIDRAASYKADGAVSRCPRPRSAQAARASRVRTFPKARLLRAGGFRPSTVGCSWPTDSRSDQGATSGSTCPGGYRSMRVRTVG